MDHQEETAGNNQTTSMEKTPFPVITHVNQFRDALNHFRTVFKQNKKPFPFVEKRLAPHHNRYSIFNYTFMTVDTFPEIPLTVETSETELEFYRIVREMRGTCFDLITGQCVSRGLQKFFNIDERESTKRHTINLNRRHLILEKADGAMVCAMFAYVDHEADTSLGIKHIRFRSKMGYDTDVSKESVEPFIYGAKFGQMASYPTYVQSDLYDVSSIRVHSSGDLNDEIDGSRSNYLNFCFKWLQLNYSPIFEYVGPDNCIVLAYAEPKLILLALRHNVDGHYVPYEQMYEDAKKFGVSVVEAYRIEEENDDNSYEEDSNSFVANNGEVSSSDTPTTGSRIDQLLAKIKSMEGLEGFVLRFDDGTMYKVKSNWYHELHRTKTSQRSKVGADKGECDIWRAILSNELDDLIAEVKYQETKDDLNNLNSRLIQCVSATTAHFVKLVEDSVVKYPDRKEYFRTFLPSYELIVKTKKANDSIEKSLIRAIYELREKRIKDNNDNNNALEDGRGEDDDNVPREEEMKAVIDVIKTKLTGKNIPVVLRTLLETLGGEKLMYAQTAYLLLQQKKQREAHGIQIAN